MRKYDLIDVAGSCPVCHCVMARRLYQVTSSQSAQHFVRQDADGARFEKMRIEIERLWNGPTCAILRCRECGFVYAYPYVGGHEVFYGLLLGAPSYPRHRFEFGATLKVLRERCAGLSGSAHLLEIGAGDGAFLQQVVPGLLPLENVLSTEFSPAGARAIRARGMRCEMTDVRLLNDPKDLHRYSAICMFQVLEHLDGLEELWNSFDRLTTPTADLFLSVPNDRSIEFHEIHGGELDMPPNHIGRWNPVAFATIGKRHGWALANHVVEPSSRGALLHGLATGRFFQARQTRGTITDRITRLASRPLRRLCSLLPFGAHYLASIPRALATDPTVLGGTQWAHFRKV